MGQNKEFKYELEQFADLRILRYRLNGFKELSLEKKMLIYHLSQAALCGRDILFDQNGKYNLYLRNVLEFIYASPIETGNETEWAEFVIYLKRLWFANGIHHHYSSEKIKPAFSEAYFMGLLNQCISNPKFPLHPDYDVHQSITLLIKLIFDEEFEAVKVAKENGGDLIQKSSVNFYENIEQQEVIEYYKKLHEKCSGQELSHGLNSKLVKCDGKILEIVWKSGRMYDAAINEIVKHMKNAVVYAENDAQKMSLKLLIEYYETGSLDIWNKYNINWVQDLDSSIDFISGFVEVYSDPIGIKGTWESLVNYINYEASLRTEVISTSAQWFEDNSPVDKPFKKPVVKGVSAKVINAAMLGGDCFPHSPLGINLPNSDWIRQEYGSKSVSIDNVAESIHEANLESEFLEEFCYDDEEIGLIRAYGRLTDNLHTDLHECLGHGSGQQLLGISPESLKEYASVIEEARADLFALYYIMDDKMLELGVLPNKEAYKAQYISYFRNGLMTQLFRIEPGKSISQTHMRNRQLISKICLEEGAKDGAMEYVKRNSKTYIIINDYLKVRKILGNLLKEIQRIKSEGDYKAAKNLVDQYGIKVDPLLHKEVLERFKNVNMPPFSGFVNPKLTLKKEHGKVVDVEVNYEESFESQMLEYSKRYSFLPLSN